MPYAPPPLRSLLRRLQGWPRRAAALTCLLLAAVSAYASHRAAPARAAEPVPVVVAARALPPGATLVADDVHVVAWPRTLVPGTALTALTQAIGRPIGAAMARGEPLTAARLLDTGVASGLRAGQVAVTIELAGERQSAMLAAGSLIDLYASDDDPSVQATATAPTTTTGAPIASNVRVLAVLRPDDADGPSGVVLAADSSIAPRLARHASTALLATLRPP